MDIELKEYLDNMKKEFKSEIHELKEEIKDIKRETRSEFRYLGSKSKVINIRLDTIMNSLDYIDRNINRAIRECSNDECEYELVTIKKIEKN